MAWIHERAGRWQAVVRRRGRPTRCRSFDSEDDAKQWADRLERRLVRSGVTLAEAIDAYSSDPDRNLSSYASGVLAWWRQALGHRALGTLRRSDFVATRDKLRKLPGREGLLARATVNWRVSAIAAVLTYAMARDWITSNPARIPKLAENNGRERLLNDEERARLLAVCRTSSEPALVGFVLTAMLSGARAGELQRLTWGDVDLERGVARLLKTKSGKRRPIPIRGPALELLRIQGDGKDVAAHVFCHADGRAPFAYRHAWERARRAAGLCDVRFHDLRHLAASHLAMAGASQRELQEILGHASSAMTTRYSHLLDSHLGDLGDRLANRLFSEQREDAA